MKKQTKGARPKGRPYFSGTHFSQEEQEAFAALAAAQNMNKSALLRQLALVAIAKERGPK